MSANAAYIEENKSPHASQNASNFDEGKDDRSSETSVSSAKEGSKDPSEAFAGKETVLVFRLRVLVILALLSAAIAVSAVVYKITYESEEDEFETQFAGSATKILSSFENIVQDKIAAVGSLALAATIYTANNNITWPLFALDSFQERAAIAKSLSDAIFIGMYPVIFDENRSAWEQFAQDHFYDICDEAIVYQSKKGVSPFGDKCHPSVTNHWINLNLNTAHGESHRGLIDKSFDLQKVVMGGFSSAPPGDFQSNTGNYMTNLIATWLSFAAGESVTYLGDPITNVYVPVFDSLGTERSPVGIVNAVIHWISFFQNVLPENIRGVTLVLQAPVLNRSPILLMALKSLQ
ncbi:hypothetical protein IV203_015216 [Nitzschia inconspicua]|uniref:Uncharacterized protein n=1 Tax=Nitzschia inconspicua TaxID=303405 RepID=A0A9K3LAL3_9STRA|nr:hypothetical protein IV203_015216 [Nitzschia inconspicua]